MAEFAYDALGYLERVQVGECVSSWVRDMSGAVMGYTEEVLGGANEPSGSSSGVVQGVRVRRNPAGKITRVEDTVKGSWCEYAYDASGRDLLRRPNTPARRIPIHGRTIRSSTLNHIPISIIGVR